jgi:hypothetical protein
MQMPITITPSSQNLFGFQALALNGNEENFPNLFDSLIEKLETILDNYKSWRDDLSKDLFSWGSKAITLVDLNEQGEERVKELALKHLRVLEKLLISTQIDIKAYEGNLPLNSKINKFALEMFNWMKEAQNLLGYTSNSEIATSLQKVNLSELPTSIALQMYNHLRSNQEKIEEARSERCQIKAAPIKPAPSLSVVRESLMGKVREAKAEMARKLAELEALTNLKIEILKEKHHIEQDLMKFHLNNAESDLHKFKIELAYAEKNNEVNAQNISQLNSEIYQLKNRIGNLESELDDDGGCIIS